MTQFASRLFFHLFLEIGRNRATGIARIPGCKALGWCELG